MVLDKSDRLHSLGPGAMRLASIILRCDDINTVVLPWIERLRSLTGKTITANRSDGVQGGITNGADINFRVAFKPTATISSAPDTGNTQNEAIVMEARGRHDPCRPLVAPADRRRAGFLTRLSGMRRHRPTLRPLTESLPH
jgi:hypothetical protein